MADRITINGGAPTVNLGVRNWTSTLTRSALVSWGTPDDSALTVQGGKIVAQAGRVGAGLVKSADSGGPDRQVRGGQTVGKYTNGALHYLHAPISVDSASFSMAAIVYIDAYTVQGRDVMAVFQSANSLRLTCNTGRYGVRIGSVEYLLSAGTYNQTGWHLLVWSQHLGSAALSVQRLGGAAELIRAPNAVTVGAACTPVFGADEIANGQVGAAPSASRAWGNCIADTFVWSGVDILSATEAAYLAALTEYFTTVYGG